MQSSRKYGHEAVVNDWKLFEHERHCKCLAQPAPLFLPDICDPNRRMFSDIVAGKQQGIFVKGWMNVAMSAMPAMPCPLKRAKLAAGDENDQTFLFLEAGTYAICYCSSI